VATARVIGEASRAAKATSHQPAAVPRHAGVLQAGSLGPAAAAGVVCVLRVLQHRQPAGGSRANVSQRVAAQPLQQHAIDLLLPACCCPTCTQTFRAKDLVIHEKKGEKPQLPEVRRGRRRVWAHTHTHTLHSDARFSMHGQLAAAEQSHSSAACSQLPMCASPCACARR
jgi:hypothetical protein